MSARLKQLRTDAATAVEICNRLLQKYPNSDSQWSEEDRKVFTTKNEEFKVLHGQVLDLEKHEEAEEEVRRGHDYYYGGRQEGEGKQDKNAKFAREQALEVHHEAFQAIVLGQKDVAKQILHESKVEKFEVYRGRRFSEENQDINERSIVMIDKHALMSSVDSAGGFLAPVDFVPQLQKDLAAMALIPGMCEMRTTSRNLIQLPGVASHATQPKSYPSKFIGKWVNEEDRTTTAQDKQGGKDYFELVNIPIGVYEPPLIPITESMREDTAVPLEPELSMLLAETAGPDLENAILTGDGAAKSPKGIIPRLSADIAFQAASGDANLATYKLFTRLNAALAPQYHPGAAWIMNQNTLAAVQELAGTTNDHPLLQPFQNTVGMFGKPIVISNFMPDIAADAFPVLLANLKLGYTLGQMSAFQVRIYDQTTPGMILLYSRWRVGGNVRRAQAMRLGKIDASLT